MVYLFVEAARPTKPGGMTTDQKRDLIISWVERALPIRTMFFDFVVLFGREKSNQPVEFNQETFDKLTKALQKSYPTMFKDIETERKRYPKALADWEKTKLPK